jgi:hypothetical protein
VARRKRDSSVGGPADLVRLRFSRILGFRLTTAEPCACAGLRGFQAAAFSRAGAWPQVTSVARLREPPPAMSAFAGPGWTSGVGGDGARCRKNLRCLKPKAHKTFRAAELDHHVLPAPGSVHGRAAPRVQERTKADGRVAPRVQERTRTDATRCADSARLGGCADRGCGV